MYQRLNGCQIQNNKQRTAVDQTTLLNCCLKTLGRNSILWPKLFSPTVRNHQTIYSNIERSEQCLVTECFSNLFLEVSHLYYKGRCVSVCGHFNVSTLTSPPILKLWDTQGYLWLPYDIMEVIKLIGETFGPKNRKKMLYVIPSALLSFLPYYCHSFQISVIPSVLVSFLPY